MRTTVNALLIILIVSAAALATAGDPQPQSPINPPTKADGAVAPDIDINQAEITAGVAPDAIDGAKAQPGEGTESPMITEIRATLDASRLEIAGLTAEAPAHRSHEADLALQTQITQLKQQAELDILAIQVRYARADGREELANQIEADIAAIISPPPVAPTETRPAPNHQH